MAVWTECEASHHSFFKGECSLGCVLKNSSPESSFGAPCVVIAGEMFITSLLFSSFRKRKEAMEVTPTVDRSSIKEELTAIHSS